MNSFSYTNTRETFVFRAFVADSITLQHSLRHRTFVDYSCINCSKVVQPKYSETTPNTGKPCYHFDHEHS